VNGDGAAVDLAKLVDEAVAGSRRALGRLITLATASPDVAAELAATSPPGRRRARRIGLTGPPGAGKSCLASALVGELRRGGARVAVLCVDPSSPFSHGAVLGDRVRMLEHTLDDGVFIRSFGSRGHVGGLTRAVPAAAELVDACGFDVVLVETVGVGQNEIELRSQVTTSLLVLSPGAGDGIQAIKSGVLEIADVITVNKSDLDGADRLARDLRLARLVNQDGWSPPVVMVSATAGRGLDRLLGAVEEHQAFLAANGLLDRRRREAIEVGLLSEALDRLGREARELLGSAYGGTLVDAVRRGELTPAEAAAELAGRAAGSVA
jgi:LAO/AO transport system kinase